MKSFKELGINENLLKILDSLGFKEPTEIQEKTIPLALAEKDIIACSKTGSGKTLAFGVGMVERIEKGKGLQGVVLTPTRELAEQVGRNLRVFSKYKKLNIVLVYGGVSINPQIERLKSADIVVGTPGRILDHIGRGTINFSKIKIVVLDEADRMLEMGFVEDVERIIQKCPEERQTLLFSATIGKEIIKIARKYMKSAIEIGEEEYVDPSKLRQFYYDVPQGLKFTLLVYLLKKEISGRIMVFCSTRKSANFVGNTLKRQGINSQIIHGGLTQNRRNENLNKFHNARVNVLVCTDVAARGLDIKDVSHVYNYDLPKSKKEYIHRIGRTARAGKEGKAINIVSKRDYENLNKIFEGGEIKIEKIELPQQIPNIVMIERKRGFNNRGFNRAFRKRFRNKRFRESKKFERESFKKVFKE